MKKIFSLTFPLVLLFLSCNKADIDIAADVVKTPVNSSIRFIREMNGKIILGGGDRGENGFIMEADAALQQFRLIQDSFPFPLYQGHYYAGRYLFTNEQAEIFYSYDLSSFFPHWLRTENFVPDLHQQPGRNMVITPDSSAIFIVSGGEFQYGLIQQSPDTFQSWYPQVFDNELRNMHFTAQGTGWAGGFGILLRSADKGKTWERKEFDHIYISEIQFISETEGVIASFESAFYYTMNGGKTWDKAKRKGKSGYVNRMAYLTNNKIVTVGSNGTICVSRDGGRNWECDRKFDGKNLYDLLVLNNDRIAVVGEDGMVWMVEI